MPTSLSCWNELASATAQPLLSHSLDFFLLSTASKRLSTASKRLSTASKRLC